MHFTGEIPNSSYDLNWNIVPDGWAVASAKCSEADACRLRSESKCGLSRRTCRCFTEARIKDEAYKPKSALSLLSDSSANCLGRIVSYVIVYTRCCAEEKKKLLISAYMAIECDRVIEMFI